MHRFKNSFLEWLVYSLIFFFLYDIIWILVDLPDFLQSVNGLYPELLVDFALCGFSRFRVCISTDGCSDSGAFGAKGRPTVCSCRTDWWCWASICLLLVAVNCC